MPGDSRIDLQRGGLDGEQERQIADEVARGIVGNRGARVVGRPIEHGAARAR